MGNGESLTDVHEHNGRIITGDDGKKRFRPFDVVPIVPLLAMEATMAKA